MNETLTLLKISGRRDGMTLLEPIGCISNASRAILGTLGLLSDLLDGSHALSILDPGRQVSHPLCALPIVAQQLAIAFSALS